MECKNWQVWRGDSELKFRLICELAPVGAALFEGELGVMSDFRGMVVVPDGIEKELKRVFRKKVDELSMEAARHHLVVMPKAPKVDVLKVGAVLMGQAWLRLEVPAEIDLAFQGMQAVLRKG